VSSNLITRSNLEKVSAVQRIISYICANNFERPTLVLDIDQVEENYHKLKAGMPDAHIHYAVKSNPHPKILQRLVNIGCRFDAASMGEIEMCLAAGANPEHISFGNTIKRWQDIEYAYRNNITLFSADAVEELEKIARHAPNSRVFIRVLVGQTEAEWPLSRKFGCDSNMALYLMDYAKTLSLDPVGISWHIGSQTKHPEMWYDTLAVMGKLWQEAQMRGHNLTLVNIGGGFPTYYGVAITEPEEYGRKLMDRVRNEFPGANYIMVEPGRGLVGNAGSIAAEVLLTSKKSVDDTVRWVYLNIGRFSGLAETEGEAIKYQFTVPGKESSLTGPCVIAGPTCDSADVLYERNKVQLPLDIEAGDVLIINSCGAYTSTYSTIAFNGFPPLAVVTI
jgi:ornithine decarboxylase